MRMAIPIAVQVRLVEGSYRGMPLRFIDTPGLELATTAIGKNTRTLHSIRAAQKKHKPDLVLYIDRCDVVSYLIGLQHACLDLLLVLRLAAFFVCTDPAPWLALFTQGQPH